MESWKENMSSSPKQKQKLIDLIIDGLIEENNDYKQFYFESLLSELVGAREYDRLFEEYKWNEGETP